MKNDNFDKVADILSDFTEVPRERIREDSELIDDLGLDSVSLFSIIFQFEEAFGIEVPEDNIPKLRTVGDILEYLEELKAC